MWLTSPFWNKVLENGVWVSWSDVGVMDPRSNPIDLESSGSGQDHDVGSLPVWLKCLVLVSPDIYPVTWMIAVQFWRRSGLIKSFQLRPDLLMGSLQHLEGGKELVIIKFSKYFGFEGGNYRWRDAIHDFKGSKSYLIWGVMHPIKGKGRESYPVSASL